jgi:hypothetical protein
MRSDSFHKQNVRRFAGLSSFTRVSSPPAYRSSTVVSKGQLLYHHEWVQSGLEYNHVKFYRLSESDTKS